MPPNSRVVSRIRHLTAAGSILTAYGPLRTQLTRKASFCVSATPSPANNELIDGQAQGDDDCPE